MEDRLKAIPKAYDVRKLVKARIDKRGRLLKAFETVTEAKKEHRLRLKRLKNHGDKAACPVKKALKACNYTRRPCGSMACFKCSRVRRIERAATVLRFLASYPLEDLAFVTLINPADAVPLSELHLFNPKNLIDRLRRQLERLGIDKSQVFLIGGVDCDWDAGWEVYQPHIHLIAWGVTKKILKKLVAKWAKAAKRVGKLRRSEPIDDLPRTVTYLDKSFWRSVARKNNPLGIHPYKKKRRPEAHLEIEILTWLHSQSAAKLRFSYGVKQYGGTIKKT